MGDRDFRWQDGERLIRFGPGALAEAPELLGPGYVLLTTERALSQAPALAEPAAALHLVAPGRVDEVAGALRPQVSGEHLVALGGGRVIDVAKALAAADPPRRVAAVPTTLSGAEMTSVHRHAAGVPAQTARVRAAIVLHDPALSASLPGQPLAASAGNALAHALEAPATKLANPVASLAALEGARRLVAGFSLTEPDREELALGALLAGYASDSAVYGLHHVMSQTLVRLGGAGHGPANVTLLPHTLVALERRAPEALAPMLEAVGEGPALLRERAGLAGVRDLGVARAVLAECAEAAAQRAELDLTPPRASRDELLSLYEAAW